VAVIPPGVDLQTFAPEGETARLDLPRPVVGVFGALIACKRIELAIEAVRRMPSGSLLVVGSGPERARLTRLGAQLGERFRLLDEVRTHEVPQLMRAIDVLCFPANEEETFGMVLIEAMACGKPVVASDDEVRRWLIGDGGELCDPTDAAALAGKLASAAGRRYGGVERARAFSWPHAVARLDEELRGL
jgi:glycosyltransferase involved in cell wall biosynthesis